MISWVIENWKVDINFLKEIISLWWAIREELFLYLYYNHLMKLYWKTEWNNEVITDKETKTLVYANWKWLFDWQWIEIPIKEYIDLIKQEWRKIKIDNQKLSNINEVYLFYNL